MNKKIKITGKTALFIDAANMFYSQKTIGFRVDYKKLYQYLEKVFQVKFAFYYTGFDPNNKKQIKFLDKLETFGYKTFRKPIKKINNKGFALDKANVDVELAEEILLDKSSTFSPRSIKLTSKNQEPKIYKKLQGFKKVLDKKSPRTRRGKFS